MARLGHLFLFPDILASTLGSPASAFGIFLARAKIPKIASSVQSRCATLVHYASRLFVFWGGGGGEEGLPLKSFEGTRAAHGPKNMSRWAHTRSAKHANYGVGIVPGHAIYGVGIISGHSTKAPPFLGSPFSFILSFLLSFLLNP